MSFDDGTILVFYLGLLLFGLAGAAVLTNLVLWASDALSNKPPVVRDR